MGWDGKVGVYGVVVRGGPLAVGEVGKTLGGQEIVWGLEVDEEGPNEGE